MGKEEIWMPISGYIGSYEISNFGRIKSLPRKNVKIMRYITPCVINGYLKVTLRQNGVNKNPLLHRLVAKHFIPEIEGKPRINHINGVKTDNRVENLEWCTQKENVNHCWDKLGRKHHLGTIRKEIAGEKDKEILYFLSIQSTEEMGFNPSEVCACLKGNKNSHRGYRWYYRDSSI